MPAHEFRGFGVMSFAGVQIVLHEVLYRRFIFVFVNDTHITITR
uniref:Uncharacterized protein n=1 Tax=Rhizophora mucronata TaxID=61149 RepID=A0A2P2Q2E3_RHIMU